MSRAFGLVVDPMRSTWRSAIAWAGSIAGLVALTVAFWPAFEGSTDLGEMLDAMLEQIPPGLIEAFGMQDFGAPAGYLRGNLYDLLVPLLLGAAAIALAVALTAGEEDAGRLELVVAQPVSRAAVFGGRAGALLGWLLVLVVATAVAQVASDAVVRPRDRDRPARRHDHPLRPPRAPPRRACPGRRGLAAKALGSPRDRAGRARRRLRRRRPLPAQRRPAPVGRPLAVGLGARRRPARERGRAVAVCGPGSPRPRS